MKAHYNEDNNNFIGWFKDSNKNTPLPFITVSKAEYLNLLGKSLIIKDKKVIEAEKQEATIKDITRLYEQSATNIVLNTVKGLGYDSIERLALYTSRPQSSYYDEATKLANWHEARAIRGLEIFDLVQNGDIKQPTIQEFLLMLPKYEA